MGPDPALRRSALCAGLSTPQFAGLSVVENGLHLSRLWPQATPGFFVFGNIEADFEGRLARILWRRIGVRDRQSIVPGEQRRHVESACRFSNEWLAVERNSERDSRRGAKPVDNKPGNFARCQPGGPVEFPRPDRAVPLGLALPGMTETDRVHASFEF